MPDRANNAKRSKQASRVTWAGMGINVLLSAAKLITGIISGSQAVTADGVHSLSDLSTDVGLLIGIKYWSQPSDKSHPYGHGRIEQVVSLFLGLTLVTTALFIGYRAFTSLENQIGGEPCYYALMAALMSICAKEFLYRWTARTAREIDSSALLANAWHHRTDALSSIPAAASVAVAMWLPGWSFVDSVGAILVALLILQAAGKIIFPSLRQLVDESVPEELRNALVETAENLPGVIEAHALRTRHIGPDIALDVHIVVPPDMSVAEGHDIAENVSKELRKRFRRVADVVVHIEPPDADD